jgi:hypothetical protein
MSELYYVAAWTDSEFLLACDHKHLTVVSAVVCAQSGCAGAYVVAFENGSLRQLTEKEEREFQLAMYGTQVVGAELPMLNLLHLTKPILN